MKLIVGQGSCGVAAGAKKVYEALERAKAALREWTETVRNSGKGAGLRLNGKWNGNKKYLHKGGAANVGTGSDGKSAGSFYGI